MKDLKSILMAILLVLSLLLLFVIFLQPSKNDSTNIFDVSATGALFEKSKPRGFEAIMQRLTAILVAAWMGIALALVVVSHKG